jgi:hypothetical protein
MTARIVHMVRGWGASLLLRTRTSKPTCIYWVFLNRGILVSIIFSAIGSSTHPARRGQDREHKGAHVLVLVSSDTFLL